MRQLVHEMLGLGPAARLPHFGALAEFATPADVYHACERVRDAGYTRWDSYTPFPVHGLEKAMGLPSSRVPWVVLVCGLSGAAGGFILQWWVSEAAYPVVISGKPFFSWPAFIPVTFELGVLCGALGAVFGMLAFNQLPQLYHSLFRSTRFEACSDDRFFIAIEAVDPKFEPAETARFLESLGATHVEMVPR
jgi:hypothetical protein